MFATFNMGTGFCVVVSPSEAPAAMDALKSAGEAPAVAGSVTGRPGRYVSIPPEGLLGHGEAFTLGGNDPPQTPPAPGGTHPPRPPLGGIHPPRPSSDTV